MDHRESCCIFDTTQYTGTPDAEPCPRVLDVPRLVRDFDALCTAGRLPEARDLLEDARDRARGGGDWRGEVSVTSELLGLYRRTGEEEKALAAVHAALALVRDHRLGRTVSGATVLLNAATTLKAFRRAADAIPIFTHAARVYAENLDPADYRFAGLYNNMALSYADTGELAAAERCFRLALRVLEKTEHPGCDSAVTWCNLAELYAGKDPEDARIDECMEKAFACLSGEDARGGYYAFTLSKCIPSFDYFGYFLYANELRKRLEEQHAGT